MGMTSSPLTDDQRARAAAEAALRVGRTLQSRERDGPETSPGSR